MAYWTAAVLHRHRERLALGLLADRGFTAYWPRVLEWRFVKGRRVAVVQPLFLGYCFIAIEQRFYDLFACPGLRHVLMDGDKPAKVPDGEIEKLKSMEKDGFVHLPDQAPTPAPKTIKVGARVRVTGGPLRGFSGLVTGMSPAKRCQVLLQVLGAQRNVSLALTDVEVP
jgi:transcriptional antiterminator RfaH